jgi:hypothetical protein
MSAVVDESGEIRWRAVLERLESDSTVEIPCGSEREFVRRTAHVTKRAEKRGIAITVERTPNAIRITPSTADTESAARGSTRSDGREASDARPPKSRKAAAGRRRAPLHIP